MRPQEEELEDEKRERLRREMNERFKEVMRTLAGQVEKGKSYAATRTGISLWNSLTVSFMTPSEIQEDDLKDAQLLGEINRETLESLDKQKDRAEKFRILLREKEKYLEAERIRKDQEITKKIGWIRQKLTEVRAEEGALERMMQFHESVEDYVTKGLRELRNLQATNEAQEMQWNGLNYDMTREGGEKLASMTFYEKLFSERLNPLESNPIAELETSLKEFESVTTIDLEAEGRTSAPADAVRPAMMPPDVPAMRREPTGTPKTKAMPKPLRKGDEKEEKKKEGKMLREKKKREEEEAASAARTGYEEAAKRPKKEGQELMKDLINSNIVPKEHLEVEITQEVWNLLGWNSRERILSEQRTPEKCYFCNAPGHRAFACSSMLRLACHWGHVTGQAKYGGYDRKHSLWCSSCAFSNATIALARGEDVKKVSGWYVHTRSACHSKDKCPICVLARICLKHIPRMIHVYIVACGLEACGAEATFLRLSPLHRCKLSRTGPGPLNLFVFGPGCCVAVQRSSAPLPWRVLIRFRLDNFAATRGRYTFILAAELVSIAGSPRSGAILLSFLDFSDWVSLFFICKDFNRIAYFFSHIDGRERRSLERQLRAFSS